MRYIDVCSGISAPTMAWKPLGWEALCFAEIEAAPRSVLAHHYPDVPLNGDFTQIRGDEYGPVDLLVGGTPCQSFSVAGLRGGLGDDRGNLALEYLRLADRARPRWLVWENVPGVLSSNGGRDFGAILGGMVELGYGFAYGVLDAQHFGVPQRRRRVFVVGYLGDWRRAAAVLFERHSLQGHPPPRREAREVSSFSVIKGAAIGREPHNGPQYGEHLDDGTCYTLNCIEQRAVVPLLDGAKGRTDKRGSRDGSAIGEVDGPMFTLREGSSHAVAFNWQASGKQTTLGYDASGLTGSLHVGQVPAIAGSAVRRLTPRECERLQGFPDNFTLVPHRGKPMADGPRYKMLGNSMAVPVVRWIGERIAAVEAIAAEQIAA